VIGKVCPDLKALPAYAQGSPPSESNCVRSNGASIDLGESIFGLDAFQINHRGLDIPMPHPTLQCANVHPMSQMLGRKRVAEFVKKEVLTVRAFRTFVAVFGYALIAIQSCPLSYPLHKHIHFAIWIAACIGKNEFRWDCISACLKALQPRQDSGRKRNSSLFPVFWRIAPLWFRRDSNNGMPEINISPQQISDLLIS